MARAASASSFFPEAGGRFGAENRGLAIGAPGESSPDGALARLEAELGEQAALIAEQAAALRHFRKLFESASEAARIGVWHCELDGERLTWTDVVYDLFDLPRGAPLDRTEILECYPPQSRARLDEVRGRAIAERRGFMLDVEIVTFAGRSRWIRITATVEAENGRPARIFGMKQDITEERRMAERLRQLAEVDALTGLANRARFQAELQRLDGDTGAALLIVDLDGFKLVNDSFGHAVGDDCLRDCAARLAAACPQARLVARIGGDEFAVILDGGLGGDVAERLAARLPADLADGVTVNGITLPIAASVGLALADGGTGGGLYRRADASMYAEKARSRQRSVSPRDAVPAHRHLTLRRD